MGLQAEEELGAIFKEDPLLLKEENQARYGSAILKNLVISRMLAICYPEYADLHTPGAMKVFERQHYDAPPPAKVLANSYRKSRVERRKLVVSDSDRDYLRAITMVAKGDETKDRQPDKGKSRRFQKHSAAEKELRGTRSDIGDRLRVAAVGFRVKISKLVEKGHLSEDLAVLAPLRRRIKGLPDGNELCEVSRTRALARGGKTRWTKTVLGHIRTAVDSGSHIVVLPEFALPPASNKLLERELRKAAHDNSARARPDHLVFCGSRHEGAYNRAFILHRKDNKLNERDHWHYKAASARGLGENIIGPRSEKFPAYPITVSVGPKKKREKIDINVLFAICYDAFDPTTFLSLVLHSAHQMNDKQERLIVVPAFNPSREFVEMLRDLSFLAECPVLYVNSLHGDARMFIAGVAVRDILERGISFFRKKISAEIDSIKSELSDKLSIIRNRKAAEPASERLRTGRLINRRRHLEALATNLDSLQRRKALKHLITVQGCQYCDRGTHKDDYECTNDILYYNIDYDLVRFIWQFRRDYFADESFLPEPFRSTELEKAAAEIENRKMSLESEAERVRALIANANNGKPSARRIRTRLSARESSSPPS